MKSLRMALLVGAAVAVSAYCVRLSASLPIARETGKKCSFCHGTRRPDVSDLRWAGLYYLEHGTLEGYTTLGADYPAKVEESSSATPSAADKEPSRAVGAAAAKSSEPTTAKESAPKEESKASKKSSPETQKDSIGKEDP